MTVHWRRTDDMNCSFRELFDTQGLPFDVSESDATGWRGMFIKLATYSVEVIMQKSGLPVLNPAASAALAGQEQALHSWAAVGNPRIRTCYKMIPGERLFSCFRPAAPLTAIIDGYRSRLTNAVGVHIRRGDNAKSSQFSPTKRFMELMHAELVRDPATQFFLATDSPETCTTLNSEFGDKIVAHEKKSLDRNDPIAICDAVVDLFCLANCRKLLGSYWSSFSDTAWEIGAIEHVIVQEEVAANSEQ
jgi:hypothetical protein